MPRDQESVLLSRIAPVMKPAVVAKSMPENKGKDIGMVKASP